MNSRRIGLPLLLVAAALLAAALLGGRLATPAPPPGNLAGASVGGAFTLVDEDARAVTDATFAGQWRLMYFGYTFCPDVCPVDTAKLIAGFRAFEAAEPARAARVQPLFVTVDPARDTPAALKTFTAAFHPRLLGLTGSPAQVAAALKTFRVFAARREGSAPDAYLMDHSAAVYLFDPAGAPVAFVAGPEISADAIAKLLADHVR